MGVSQEDINLDQVPLGEDTKSWVLRSDSRVYHNGEVLFSLEGRVEEGDIVVSVANIYIYFLLQLCMNLFRYFP